MPVPVITKVDPTKIPCVGGTKVTILGNGFVKVIGVAFGGVPAKEFVVEEETRIVAVAPAHAAGPVSVQVATESGVSDPGSAQVTYGDDAGKGGHSPPARGGAANACASATRYSISFVLNSLGLLPARMTGVLDVLVTTLDSRQPLRVGAPWPTFAVPMVTSVSPNHGPKAGGTQITIGGSGFVNVTGVSFGASGGVEVIDCTETQITVNTPKYVSGPLTVDVIVGTTGGPSQPNPPKDQFTYDAY
jgi:hypothetical protein